jgi:hypothetical protein
MQNEKWRALNARGGGVFRSALRQPPFVILHFALFILHSVFFRSSVISVSPW